MNKLAFLSLAFALPALSAYASSPAAAPGKPASPGGWEALSTLQTGNMRFYEGQSTHPNLDLSRRELVAKGQNPHTIIVSCSDSRVPPEEIFDQGLGDIFTVRNAGNVMSSESIASIEYAVEHLGSRLLIVMGHESCGAVGAAINTPAGASAGSESLDALVRRIRSGLSAAAVTAAAGDKTFRQGVKENVTSNLRSLIQKSEIVRTAIAKHGLVVGQAIYNLKSGRVEFWDVGRVAGLDAPAEKAVIKNEAVVEEVIAPEPAPKAKKKAKAPAAH